MPPIVAEPDSARVTQITAETDKRFVDHAKHRSFINEGLGSGVVVESQARSVEYWSGNSMNDTGLAYNISGRATVIEASVGERLAGFQDPIKAIFGTTVCKDKTVIVTRKYVIGGGVTITPERAPARTVQVKEDVTTVELNRYGGDITMNTNLFLTPQLAQAEMDMKVNAQKGELEKKLIELGYNEILSKAVRLPDAAVRANPTFVGGTVKQKQSYATMVYNRSCFGAFAKHEFPLANLLASCKKTGAYLAADGPSTLLVLPHGSSEMLRYTKKSSMKYSISGLSTADQKPVNMSISNVSEDPSSGVKIMVHVPPTNNSQGAAFPTTSSNCLSETVTIYTFHKTNGAYAVNFQTGTPHPVTGDGLPGLSGSGGGGGSGSSGFGTPAPTEREFTGTRFQRSALAMLQQGLADSKAANTPTVTARYEQAITELRETDVVLGFLDNNANVRDALSRSDDSKMIPLEGFVSQMFTSRTGELAVLARTLATAAGNASAEIQRKMNKVATTCAGMVTKIDTGIAGDVNWGSTAPATALYVTLTSVLNDPDDMIDVYLQLGGIAAGMLANLRFALASKDAVKIRAACVAFAVKIATKDERQKDRASFVPTATESGMLAQSSTAGPAIDDDEDNAAFLAACQLLKAGTGDMFESLCEEHIKMQNKESYLFQFPTAFPMLHELVTWTTTCAAPRRVNADWTPFDVIVDTCIRLSSYSTSRRRAVILAFIPNGVEYGFKFTTDAADATMHLVTLVTGHNDRLRNAASHRKCAHAFAEYCKSLGDTELIGPLTALLRIASIVYRETVVPDESAMAQSFQNIARFVTATFGPVQKRGIRGCRTSIDFANSDVTFAEALNTVESGMVGEVKGEHNGTAVEIVGWGMYLRSFCQGGVVSYVDTASDAVVSSASNNRLSSNIVLEVVTAFTSAGHSKMQDLVSAHCAIRSACASLCSKVSGTVSGVVDTVVQSAAAVKDTILSTSISDLASYIANMFATTGKMLHSFGGTIGNEACKSLGSFVEQITGVFSSYSVNGVFDTKLITSLGLSAVALAVTADKDMVGIITAAAAGLRTALSGLLTFASDTSDDDKPRVLSRLGAFAAETMKLMVMQVKKLFKATADITGLESVVKMLRSNEADLDYSEGSNRTPQRERRRVKKGKGKLQLPTITESGMFRYPAAKRAWQQDMHRHALQMAASAGMMASQGATAVKFVDDVTVNALTPNPQQMTVRRLRVKMSHAIIAKCGSDTGELLVGYPMTGVSTNQRTESMTIALRVYLGAVLKKPENVTIIPHVAFEGVESCDFEDCPVTVATDDVNDAQTATFDFQSKTETVPFVPGAEYRRDGASANWIPVTNNPGALGHLDHFDYVDCVNGLQVYNAGGHK